MHKLIDYVCSELEELEHKASKDGKLSMSDLQIADTLAHLKKNLMKTEEMSKDEGYSSMGYSRRGGYSRRMSYDGGSYADDGMGDFVRPDGSYRDGGMSYRGRGRGAKRDAMGRYSSAGDEVHDMLYELMNSTGDEHTRNEIRKLIEKM